MIPDVLKRLPAPARVWLLAFALGLPFVGRAYFVDDAYHMRMAQGLLEHPSRPYDFTADDAGPDNLAWERGSFPRMVNPPVHHYLLAFWHAAGGGRLWAVRLGMLAFAALAAVFLFQLSRLWLVPPWPAAALAVLTPAFWLSSYSLLIDSTMLTFFLGGLWAWTEGLRRRRAAWLAAAGLLMGCAVLTKYPGWLVGLLALVWWRLQEPEDRRPVDLLWLGVPAAMLAGWSAWNVATYGAVHLLESSKRVVQHFDAAHVLVFLSFFSGVLLLPLAAWGWAWRSARRLFAGAALGAAGLAVFLSSAAGGYGAPEAVMIGLFSAAGLLFFVQAAGFAGSGRAADRFLVIWLLLGALQMIFVMGWFAARYYLVLLPPAVLLTLRAAQVRWRHAPSALARYQACAFAALFAAGALLAWADHAGAGVNLRIVEDLKKDGLPAEGRRCYSLADTFSGGTLREAGWITAFPSTRFHPGDLVLLREVIMPAWWFRPAPGQFRLLKTYEYRGGPPVHLMDNGGAAGFYASVWGALPFTFTRGPLDRYRLLEVVGGADGRS